MMQAVITLINFVIGAIVNLFAMGCGLALGAIIAMVIILVVNHILYRISLRWCHARVAHSDDMWPTEYGLRDFTYKDVRKREVRAAAIYTILLIAMIAPFIYLVVAGDPEQLKWYWGAIDQIHVMLSPMSVYAGIILISFVLFFSNIHEQGTYHFDVLEVDEGGERILVLGSKGYYLGITLDDRGKIVNV